VRLSTIPAHLQRAVRPAPAPVIVTGRPRRQGRHGRANPRRRVGGIERGAGLLAGVNRQLCSRFRAFSVEIAVVKTRHCLALDIIRSYGRVVGRCRQSTNNKKMAVSRHSFIRSRDGSFRALIFAVQRHGRLAPQAILKNFPHTSDPEFPRRPNGYLPNIDLI
jgi:hypothetical protein